MQVAQWTMKLRNRKLVSGRSNPIHSDWWTFIYLEGLSWRWTPFTGFREEPNFKWRGRMLINNEFSRWIWVEWEWSQDRWRYLQRFLGEMVWFSFSLAVSPLCPLGRTQDELSAKATMNYIRHHRKGIFYFNERGWLFANTFALGMMETSWF